MLKEYSVNVTFILSILETLPGYSLLCFSKEWDKLCVILAKLL